MAGRVLLAATPLDAARARGASCRNIAAVLDVLSVCSRSNFSRGLDRRSTLAFGCLTPPSRKGMELGRRLKGASPSPCLSFTSSPFDLVLAQLDRRKGRETSGIVSTGQDQRARAFAVRCGRVPRRPRRSYRRADELFPHRLWPPNTAAPPPLSEPYRSSIGPRLGTQRVGGTVSGD